MIIVAGKKLLLKCEQCGAILLVTSDVCAVESAGAAARLAGNAYGWTKNDHNIDFCKQCSEAQEA